VTLYGHASQVTLISEGRSDGGLGSVGGPGVDAFPSIDTVGRVRSRQRDRVGVLSTRGGKVSGRKTARDRTRGRLFLCLEIQVSTSTRSRAGHSVLTFEDAMLNDARESRRRLSSSKLIAVPRLESRQGIVDVKWWEGWVVCCGVGMPQEFEGLTSARGDGRSGQLQEQWEEGNEIGRTVTVDSSLKYYRSDDPS
jgi:hypothetical protein